MRIDIHPPRTAEAIAETLLTRSREAKPLARDPVAPRSYALVDHLFLSDRRGQEKLGIGRWPYRNLLDHLGGAEDHQSLILIALPLQAEALLAAIRQLCAACSGWPMLSFIVSRLALDELAGHLRTHTEVRLAPDDEEFLLRIGDTRVHAALSNVLTDAQHGVLLAPLLTWLRFERDGRLRETRCPDEPSLRATDMPHLTTRQWESLLAHCWPDAVISQLHQDAPAYWHAIPPSRQHADVTRWLAAAVANEHHTAIEQLSYCRAQFEA